MSDLNHIILNAKFKKNGLPLRYQLLAINLITLVIMTIFPSVITLFLSMELTIQASKISASNKLNEFQLS